jgi:hypothetical protein
MLTTEAYVIDVTATKVNARTIVLLLGITTLMLTNFIVPLGNCLIYESRDSGGMWQEKLRLDMNAECAYPSYMRTHACVSRSKLKRQRLHICSKMDRLHRHETVQAQSGSFQVRRLDQSVTFTPPMVAPTL